MFTGKGWLLKNLVELKYYYKYVW